MGLEGHLVQIEVRYLPRGGGEVMTTVKAAREEKRWSKHRLAKEAGVNNHAVANIENGT